MTITISSVSEEDTWFREGDRSSRGLGNRAASVDCFGLSRPGAKRKTNEDQFLIADLGRSMRIERTSVPRMEGAGLAAEGCGKLLAVADGLGGHGDGDAASALAIEQAVYYVLEALPWLGELARIRPGELEEEVNTLLRACQTRLEAAVKEGGYYPRMGTTLTAAYVVFPVAFVIHAGDSRLYRLHDGEISQVTTDHTLAQKLADRNVLSREQAAQSQWRHQLWNAIGAGRRELTGEVARLTLEEGDALVLCTDGLTRYVEEEALESELRSGSSAEATVRGLMRRAVEAGGSDDITLVVARFCRPS